MQCSMKSGDNALSALRTELWLRSDEIQMNGEKCNKQTQQTQQVQEIVDAKLLACIWEFYAMYKLDHIVSFHPTIFWAKRQQLPSSHIDNVLRK
ncbi:hypothetical protein GQX74_007264 [Glossina fuscipes]|nr:hypothetical protein GQX74_007264 [Glossina fuscipes]